MGALLGEAGPAALPRSPLFWGLLATPIAGTALGCWAAARRIAAERRLRRQRDEVRYALDEVREEARVARAIVRHAHAAVLAYDAGGRVFECNPAAERIFGRSRDALRRCTIVELLPDLSRIDDGPALERRSAAGEPLGREWRTRGRHADGTAFPVQLERASLGAGLHVVTVREATSVVKEEQRRVRDAVRAEQDRVVDLSRHRAEFLNQLGRELRAEVGRVLSTCEALAGGPDAERAAVVRDSAHAMLVVVDKVLNLGMADDSLQELTLEPVAVPGLLDELVHSLQPLFDRHGNRLVVRVSDQVPILTTDRQKLAHAVRNLLGNAARYTRDGRVTVEVVVEPGRHTDWIAFFVSDTGVGLGPDALDQLFERFSLPDAASAQEYLSVGTGLALSQHCARLLGGHIAVRSAPGVGSTFTLRVPARRPR